MPSSSARCAQLPRAADKVPFYSALKKFKDYLNGLVPEYIESDYVFTDPKYNQTSPLPDIDQSMNPDGIFDENQAANVKRKKRGRPKKKNDGSESIDCKQTKELDGEISDDKLNGSKKKRGRPKKSADGESPVKAPKKSKKSAGNLSEQNLNAASERSSISPMMESSSSFSNSLSSSHQQPVPVQQAPQQNGKCNQSRSQSPSFNMCHQPNLEMKPMMHGNVQFNHNQPQQQLLQQDTNITYRHQIKSHESSMKDENFENLNLDELPMFQTQAQPEFKPQIPVNTNPIAQNNIDKMPKMNGISGDNNLKYHQHQPQHYQNDIGNNQLNLASQQQQQQQQSFQQNHRQQLPPVQQIQPNSFHTSTPHLISNITSDTRNVYQQQQHVQRPEPTAYAMSNVAIAPEKSFVPTNQPPPAAQQTQAQTQQQAKDISLKSLSGLESLVDQISNANPEHEIPASAPPMPAAPTPSYPTPYGHGERFSRKFSANLTQTYLSLSLGAQHYFHPSHPQNHGQGFPSAFPPIGSFPNPSNPYSSFGNYHQNLINASPHHVGMPVNPVYPNSGYPPHPSMIPYGNSYPTGSFNSQGSSNYYNSMFDRLNF